LVGSVSVAVETSPQQMRRSVGGIIRHGSLFCREFCSEESLDAKSFVVEAFYFRSGIASSVCQDERLRLVDRAVALASLIVRCSDWLLLGKY